jgi:hypothetical protein
MLQSKKKGRKEGRKENRYDVEDELEGFDFSEAEKCKFNSTFRKKR